MTKKLKAEEAKETHLTLEEAQKTLAAITRADMIRLSKFEAWLDRNNPANTLLVDAITKTWDGTRSWKRGMGVFEHLCGVMRSLANNEHKKKTISKKSMTFTNDDGEEKSKIAIQVNSPSPETLMIERELQEEREKKAQAETKEILNIFAKDEDAMWILMGEMDGQTAEEIRELSGMDQTRFNTTRRRIRRKLDKHFPDKKKN